MPSLKKGPPSSEGLTHDLCSRLNPAFMTLPPETRAALWLHLVDGEGFAEVADTLDLKQRAALRRSGSILKTGGESGIRTRCLEGVRRLLPSPESS